MLLARGPLGMGLHAHVTECHPSSDARISGRVDAQKICQQALDLVGMRLIEDRASCSTKVDLCGTQKSAPQALQGDRGVLWCLVPADLNLTAITDAVFQSQQERLQELARNVSADW